MSVRFGYEYFEKLSSVAVKELFIEHVPDEPADDDGLPGESADELGVITLGVNEVRARWERASCIMRACIFCAQADRACTPVHIYIHM